MTRRICKSRLTTVAPAVFLICASIFGSSAIADDAPEWLREAAAVRTGKYDQAVAAVILLKEQRIRVEENGRVTTTERGAVRVIAREGRDEASAMVSYLTETGKVRDFRAWLIRESGAVKKYGKDAVLDLAAARNDVFNEVRLQAISASDDADAGTVFGYEWTTEDRSVFTQFDFQFQETLPVVTSRFILELPLGWRAEGVPFNNAGKLEAKLTGSSYVWELKDLPFIALEPASPPVTNLAPRLAVSYYPPEGKQVGISRTFQNWREVSKWLSELADPQAEPDDAMAQEVQGLVAGAKTEVDRIDAIARFVQSVNYVSIQTGIGRGGGYKPRRATEVFTRSYGDCKDKANLMRAMLKIVGTTSYPVVIYSGDPTYVREEWASPQQFNHCIIAVKVKDETEAPTIIRHPQLGRLLIFDPTDEDTPVGDLPDHEQGSLALVVAGDAGALLRMPVTPPEANRLERETEAELSADGALNAAIREHAFGQAAVAARREFRGRSRGDYMKMIERWITQGVGRASVTSVDPKDGKDFSLEVRFAAPSYAQIMQNRLMVLKPAIVSRRESVFLTAALRKHPVMLESNAYSERMTVRLPEGFTVDELPDAVTLDAPFGKYAAQCAVKDGRLTYTRSLVLQSTMIPVEQYSTVRNFFDRIRASEQSPVVLVRK